MSDPLELLWVDPKRAARACARTAYRKLLEHAARDDERDEPALAQKEVPPAARRDVLLVLARGELLAERDVAAAMSQAVRADGRFSPPYVLVAGELSFSFEEIEILKRTVSTATPFAGADEALQSALALATDFLKQDLPSSPAVAELLTARVREAFGRTKRAVAPNYLEAQTERALIEQRLYQKRSFVGAPHLRSLLASMLVYVPVAAADHLPLHPRFPARILAQAHVVTDQFESHPFALEAIAISRVVTLPDRRRS